jgi:hypothetical protein
MGAALVHVARLKSAAFRAAELGKAALAAVTEKAEAKAAVTEAAVTADSEQRESEREGTLRDLQQARQVLLHHSSVVHARQLLASVSSD